jgi:hypothetical protein
LTVGTIKIIFFENENKDFDFIDNEKSVKLCGSLVNMQEN